MALKDGSSIQTELHRLAVQHNLLAIYSFGSRSIEIARRAGYSLPKEAQKSPGIPSESDVDIGVLPAHGHPLTARDQVRLAIELEDILDVTRVDLVVLTEASPYLALDIVCGELICTTDEDAEATYQLYVLRRAGDLEPFERQRRQMLLDARAI